MNERTTNPELNKLIETYEKFAETLREENPNVTIPKEAHRKLVAERLAFGFDSIYFRYAAAIDELVRYKAKDPVNINAGKDPIWYQHWANDQKMHFWQVLEQLTGAHELEDSQKKTRDTDKDGRYGT